MCCFCDVAADHLKVALHGEDLVCDSVKEVIVVEEEPFAHFFTHALPIYHNPKSDHR